MGQNFNLLYLDNKKGQILDLAGVFNWSGKRDSKTACRFKPNTEIPIKSGS